MSLKSKYFPFIIFSFAYLAGCITIYFFIDRPVKSEDINLINRGIDSPLRLWLNGYLGVFFGFRFLGVINWLVIPFAIYYFISEHKYQRWLLALLLFYAAALLIIISQGYFNSRYQITLLPLTVSLVIYFTWVFSEKSQWKNGKYFLATLFFTVTVFNDYKYFVRSNKDITSAQSKITSNVHNYSSWLSPLPTRLLDFIQHLPISDNAKVLVNNVPFYFYYIDKPGIYYWCQDDFYYDAHGPKPLMKNHEGKNLSDLLLNDLHCKYIITTTLYDGYSKVFDDYVTDYCKHIYSDANGYQIYEISAN